MTHKVCGRSAELQKKKCPSSLCRCAFCDLDFLTDQKKYFNFSPERMTEKALLKTYDRIILLLKLSDSGISI